MMDIEALRINSTFQSYCLFPLLGHHSVYLRTIVHSLICPNDVPPSFKVIIPFAISSASGSIGQLSISSGNEDVSKLFHFGTAFGKQALISDLLYELSNSKHP